VAKHRQAKNRRGSSVKRGARQRRRPPSVLFVGTTAAAVSAVLVFGHATNTTPDSPQVQLAAATIGIGGRGDPDAVNIPNKLQGQVVPFGSTFPNYLPVVYPAGFDIDNSVAAGVPVLDQTIKSNSGQFLLVVGYSEGSIVAEKVRRNLDPSDPGAPPLNQDMDPSKPGLLWVMIASPNVPNGGIFARFPGVSIPFFVTSNGAAQPSPYDTTYVTNEYDPYADFPAYFNPLSLANSLFAVVYVHPDQYYDSIDYDPLNPDDPSTTPMLVKTVTNSLGGTDRYVFVPAAHLPLFAPVRQIAALIHLTPFTEPVLGAFEPLVRLVVDMGYTDRQNLNPEVPVRFSLITPPGKVVEAVVGVPGALGQGLTNLSGGLGSIPAPLAPAVAPTNSPTNSPAVNAKSAPEESLVKNDPPADVTETPQEPSGTGTGTTDPPVSSLSDPGPTLGAVTGDGNKTTPKTTTKTTSPKKNVFTQLADTVKGFLSGKKTPTPTSEPTDSTPSSPSSQGQSEGPASNAA
jgi:diacyltrehalose acyltransferase